MSELLQTELQQPQQVLYLDLSVYLAGIRHNRNVLDARVSMSPATNFVLEKTLRLTENLTAGSEHTLIGESDNKITILSASKALRLEVTTTSGVHDLGSHTFFVFSAPIVQMKMTNVADETVDVRIIQA